MVQRRDFPLAEAQLISLFLQAITYGIYLVSFALCIRAFFARYKRKERRYGFILVALGMFVFATMDVAFSLQDVLRVFVFHTGPGDADEEFEELSYWANVMKTVNIQCMALIGDGMLVYRCFVVFTRSCTVISVPLALWLADAAIGAVIVWLTATLHNGDIVSSSRLAHMITTFLAITLVTNLLTTGLIVWRIRRIDSECSRLVALPRQRQSRLANATRIIAESGLLYTTFVLATFLAEISGSNAVYDVADMMLVVIGIAFNLIIIRVDQGVAVGGTYNEPTLAVASNVDSIVVPLAPSALQEVVVPHDVSCNQDSNEVAAAVVQ